MSRRLKTTLMILVLSIVLVGLLAACQPVEKPWQDPFPIIEGAANEQFKDHTTKEQAIDRAVGSMENLLTHLDSDIVSETGYYIGANVTVNTENGSAFILNLQANLFTYPYEIKDEKGNVILDPETGLPLVDEEKLAIHNQLIKYSDIILEWFDGASNEMLIGFYFDGINPNSADTGNDLYLNLQGSKRIFKDFGDSVLYQQLIRLITHFNLETVIGSASSDGTASSSFSVLREALDLAITTNYKQTLNGDNATIFFNNVNLSAVSSNVTSFVQGIFSPFEDKLDPLSLKYLGFLFSTLGNTSFTTINTDMQFIMTPDENINKEIMTSLILDASGDAEVARVDAVQGTVRETIPYMAHIAAEYSVRISTNIVFNKEGYTLYDYGNYEYTGDMYIPMLDLRLDVLLRTDMNEIDNSINKIFMHCRDLATDDLIIGLYYANELTYLDVQGLQELYGGVKIEDIGLPKAYRGGFDLADTLAKLFDFIDTYIVIAVDNILYGQSSENSGSQYETITRLIIGNMKATMKDENDPSSRATEQIRIDFEMIRAILSQTSETGVDYTTEQLILIFNQQFNVDIESLASILGLSVQELLEKSYFYITYDVDAYSIRVEVYTTAEMSESELEHNGPKLIVRIDLYPQHIGEFVRIVFPSFDGFKPLEDVMTYSGYLEGQFIFAATEEVDLSELLGSFMGDESGLNTPFILPDAADIYFTLSYDQYIRAQVLANGRWTRKSRSAFSLYLYMVVRDQITPLARVYANDVSLNTADPVEELGYVWLDYICVENMPKFKVREDHFVKGFYNYMGYDFENEDEDIVMGLTDIVKALMEDSWATFEPDVIRVTTSNSTIKNFFRVDELIGTISIQIGFRQRVFDIDQLEVTFAMYTVGDLPDISGESVYSVELHKTIPVYFNFGTRIEERNFYFLYDENSIAVVNDKANYMPATKHLFMGVMRDYCVHILTDMGTKKINDLVENNTPWEPLEPIPTTAVAYYGEDNQTSRYDADYKLHAVYDRNTRYYTVLNDLGYEIVYDLENDIYVIGLGSQYKYDKAFTFLNSDVKYYYKEYVNTGKVTVSYDLGMRIPGWYIVKDREENILYNSDKDYYVVETDEIRRTLLQEKFGQKEVEIRVPDESTSDPDDFIISTELVDATIYVKTINHNSQAFIYDLISGYYVRRFEVGAADECGVIYSLEDNRFYLRDAAYRATVIELVGSNRVDVPSWLDWDSAPYNAIDWNGENYDKIDWADSIFGQHEWTDMDWEDMTINGGIFVAYVIIGEGKMATFRKNVRIKVLNREVVTDKYVNILTPDGAVRAPVADTIEVDPYIYLLYKAYYQNSLSYEMSDSERARGFVSWYFAHYNDVRFRFTEIYGAGQEDENTPDEVGSFEWKFDDTSTHMQTYSEFDINNRHFKDEKKYTYVYTVFHNQVIALALDVLPRNLKEIWMAGETEADTYTVDALQEATYTLPTSMVYVFEGVGGELYALNLNDYYNDFVYTNAIGDEVRIQSLFSTMHAGFEGMPLGNVSLLASDNALPIIKWTNPVADNIKLVNVDAEGKVYPFLNSDTNVTTAFLDFANYVDFARNWYYVGEYSEGWFYVETVKLTVLAPDKVIATKPYTVYVGGANPTAEHVRIVSGSVTVINGVQNIVMAEYYEGSDCDDATILDTKGGIFFVDPYDSSTWQLPTAVYALFNGRIAGDYDAYRYNVNWRKISGDSAHRFDVINGVYYLDEEMIDGNSKWFYVEGEIGEGTNTMKVYLLVYIMSGYTRQIVYTMDDGAILYLHYDNEDMLDEQVTAPVGPDDVTLEYKDPHQLLYYTYRVNTYARFNIPTELHITFADGSERTYKAKWGEHAPWAPGTTVTAYSTLGDASSRTADIALTFRMRSRVIKTMTFLNADSEAPEIVYNVANSTILVQDLYLDKDSHVYYLDGEGNRQFYGGTRYTPYQFFEYIFGNIRLDFVGENFVIENMTDAVRQAELPIFGTFDTQKLIQAYTDAYGQGIDIYVGQERGAHDFRVIIEFGFDDDSAAGGTKPDRDYVEFADDQSAVFDPVTIEAFNADNTPRYPEGFIFKDELQFSVKLKSGEIIHYGNPEADPSVRPVPEFWSIVCPDEITSNNFWAEANAADRMPEIEPFQKIDRIGWEQLMIGGGIWVSAMLENGSRIYYYFSSDATPIGSNFHSSKNDTSPYKIINGVITIQNLYDNYTIGNYITMGSLPSRIAIGLYNSVTIEKTNIVWTRIASVESLNAIDYRGSLNEHGEVDAIPLARSTIMGQEVILYLRVLAADVVKVGYDSLNADVARHFESEVRDENTGIITVNFDAYHNSSYAGTFVLPEVLRLDYAAAGREVVDPNVTIGNGYQYVGLVYYRSDGTAIRNIPYNLTGHLLTPLEGEDNRNLNVTATLRDGQRLKFKIHFYDKQITDIMTAIDIDGLEKQLIIDPYSENIAVPNDVVIHFLEGAPLEYRVNWNVPENFEVKFDTARRIPEGFNFTGVLTGFRGLAEVALVYHVSVEDRVMDSYTLVEGMTDIYGSENVHAFYHYTDIFAGKASDLPGTISTIGRLYNHLQWNSEYALLWNFSDEDITAQGSFASPEGYILVTGHIYNADRGQPIAIKVYIDSFEFAVIRQLTPDGRYEAMDPSANSIRFIISAITGYSTRDHYMVDFNVRSATSPAAAPAKVTLKFVPEGIDPTTVSGGSENYRLYWNRAALNAAYGGDEASGPFYFGNATRSDIISVGNCVYHYEMPSITHIDLGYGMGVEKYAIYVINPLSPDFSSKIVKAKGKFNNAENVSLEGEGVGLITRIIWPTDSAQRINASYLAGGVIRDFTATLELTNPNDENFSYTQSFDVMLVILDMSPTSYINNSTGMMLTSAHIKTNYNATTYNSQASNPYKDVYLSELIYKTVERSGDNVLNTAIRDLGLKDATFTYIVEEFSSAIYINAGTSTQYSSTVIINQRTYKTNIVYRQWNSTFRIEGIDMGYGLGYDKPGADQSKIIYVVDPLAPGAYTIALDADKIVGSYKVDNSTTKALSDASLGFTFEATWWNTEANGSTFTFAGNYLSGGCIDDWKVTISVKKDGVEVYSQIVDVMLVLMDMLPAARTVSVEHFKQNDVSPRQTYAANTYDDIANPYGNNYRDLELWTLFATHGAPTAKYNYEVNEWLEPEQTSDGKTIARSREIIIYDSATDVEIGRYVCDGIIREIAG